MTTEKTETTPRIYVASLADYNSGRLLGRWIDADQPVEDIHREIAEMLAYFEAHTYLGADSRDAITLANRVAGRQPTKFDAWARANFAIPAAA